MINRTGSNLILVQNSFEASSLSSPNRTSLAFYLNTAPQMISCCSNLRALLFIFGYDGFWSELARPVREDKSRRKKPWRCITLLAAANKEIRSFLYNDPQLWIHTAMVIDTVYQGLGIRMLMRMFTLCQNDFQRSSIDVKTGRDLVPISYIWYGHHYKALDALQVSLMKYGSIQRMLLARKGIMSTSVSAKMKRESAKLCIKNIRPVLRITRLHAPSSISAHLFCS
mmetsp:Transcript_49349/g.102948  ORF Transcript_49349/g.102948 Transcript_49349/m.102948 type:complete len:226 (-) Transcript_49349:417-1094(-)